MKRCIMTVCSADWYQYYIPIFVWSINRVWEKIDIRIYIRGFLSPVIEDLLYECCMMKPNLEIVENYKKEYPNLVSTTNSLRFVTEDIDGYNEVFVTDIDFFFTESPVDLFHWHKIQLENMSNDCYSGCHGPLIRPPRPSICTSWTGDFQRIAGGFVMLYPAWWKTTKEHREHWDDQLKQGKWGHFREADEVMLYRIIRDSGLPIAPKVPFPRYLRQIHLGDYRPNMTVRNQNMQKMRSLVDGRCINQFLNALEDRTFSMILDCVRQKQQMDEVLSLAIEYCQKRKRNEA